MEKKVKCEFNLYKATQLCWESDKLDPLKEPKKIVKLYRKCIKLNPNFAEAYFALSFTLPFLYPNIIPKKIIKENDYYWHQAHKIIKQNPNYKPIDKDIYLIIKGKPNKKNQGILTNKDIEKLLISISCPRTIEDSKEEYKRISSEKKLTPKEYRNTYGIIPSNQELRKKGFTDNDLIEIGLLKSKNKSKYNTRYRKKSLHTKCL